MRTTRLNENDLARIVRKVLKEEDTSMGGDCFSNTTISIPSSCKVKLTGTPLGTGMGVSPNCVKDLGKMMTMDNLKQLTKLLVCLSSQSGIPPTLFPKTPSKSVNKRITDFPKISDEEMQKLYDKKYPGKLTKLPNISVEEMQKLYDKKYPSNPDKFNRLINGPDEEKHIMGLYEQNERGFKQKVRKFFDKLFNRLENGEFEQVKFDCKVEKTFTCPPNTIRGEGIGYDPLMSAKMDAEKNWLKAQGKSSTVTVGNTTTTNISGTIPSGVEVVRYMECKGKVVACISVPKQKK